MIDPLADTSDIERARRAVGRAGFVAAVIGLVLGVASYLLGLPSAAQRIFQITLGVLILMPVKNVLAVLADEVRRRDWWFALIAVGVLAELAYSVLDRLR